MTAFGILALAFAAAAACVAALEGLTARRLFVEMILAAMAGACLAVEIIGMVMR